jgi:hypothetical protein
MPELTLNQLKPEAAKYVSPFLDEILAGYREKIDSIYITGTAITDDFDEKISDVNSVVVLKEMDLKFLGFLAPLGKKYGKHKVAAPLIMTPDYIKSSIDVFPLEFLNFKLIHSAVFGRDLFQDLVIDRMDLRHQCERELKVKLIWIRQSYLSAQGDRKLLTDRIIGSITDYVPLFRGIISLFGKTPPVRQHDVIKALAEETEVDTEVFARVLIEKRQKIKPSMDELNTIFEEYYAATEKLGKIVDEIKQ